MATFFQWVKGLETRNDYLGDLARAIVLDRSRPRSNSKDTWINHLEGIGASGRVIDNFIESWNLYEANETPPESPGQYTLKTNNDRWSIARPNLPSYWTATPDFVRVMPSEKKQPIESDRTSIGGKVVESNMVQSNQFCEAVETIGRYFNKEFHYDFLPYTLHEHIEKGSGKIHPYLFFDPRDEYAPIARPIGACSFYLPEEINHWVMIWIWFHPYARKRGHLTRYWPQFKKYYGEFKVKVPLSLQMNRFLKKMGHNFLIK